MAIQPGKDFAVAAKVSIALENLGVGNCTVVATRTALYLFPHDTIGETERQYSIGGRKPGDVIAELLADPATTAERLEQQLAAWAAQETGPQVKPLAGFKRMRIFTGFIRRSVVFSTKETGYEFGALGFRPGKAELAAFLEFFKDFPGLEVK
ncbi:MAG: hypothetical protein KF696_06855 [Planctomycetes bacterium]|nr:hypothetical protein [Planctomycetota bacterium]MCW8135275.1 hypothetical protein [Planctomycetota bacterium]